MSLTWIEDASSRSSTIFRLGRKDSSTRTRVWNVSATLDEDALHADINSRISSTYSYWTFPGQPLVKLRAESYSVEHQGDGLWKLTVSYEKAGADNPAQTGPVQRSQSFDTSGATQKITHALNKVTVNGTTTLTEMGEKVYGPNGLAQGPSMKGAVNVDDSGVNGVDIIVPAFKWSETHEVPARFMTRDYIRRLAWLTGTTNNAPFRGFQIGEVLFTGASGSYERNDERGDGPGQISFTFEAKPNAGVGQTIPPAKIGDIGNIESLGWEYVWVKYVSAADDNWATIVRAPAFVYVNKVYREGDFSTLGIGVA